MKEINYQIYYYHRQQKYLCFIFNELILTTTPYINRFQIYAYLLNIWDNLQNSNHQRSMWSPNTTHKSKMNVLWKKGRIIPQPKPFLRLQ
jgi:hypothetical protein